MNERVVRIIREWDIPWENHTPIEALVRCKFITVKGRDNDVITLIFDAIYTHDKMYQTRFRGKGILIAGFITYDEDRRGNVVATGRSTSIKCNPHATPQDTVIINNFLRAKKYELEQGV